MFSLLLVEMASVPASTNGSTKADQTSSMDAKKNLEMNKHCISTVPPSSDHSKKRNRNS